MKFYFYIGLLIIAVSEILLFAGVRWVMTFFTPFVWTGYILLIDSIVFKIKNESWIIGKGRTFLLMIPLSVVFWYIFEFFNLFLKNWRYEGLPTAVWISAIGFTWAFATIGPGIFETLDLLESVGVFRLKTRQFEIPKSVLYLLIIIGAGCLISVVITPAGVAKYLVICLWLGPIFLLDPINYIKDRKSILGSLLSGNVQKILCLIVAGVICGFLWEFWNYRAATGWVYEVPYLAEPKIFKMPLFGYLGFPALALDYYVLYSFVLRLKDKEC